MNENILGDLFSCFASTMAENKQSVSFLKGKYFIEDNVSESEETKTAGMKMAEKREKKRNI